MSLNFQPVFFLSFFFRDHFSAEASSLKRQNEDLVLSTLTLERDLQKQREKMIGSEEQLRKLEQKVSMSDINIAKQVTFLDT